MTTETTNTNQIKTAEFAKQKLNLLNKLKELEPVLKAAVEFKTIQYKSKTGLGNNSKEGSLSFDGDSNQYSVLPDMVKVTKHFVAYQSSGGNLYILSDESEDEQSRTIQHIEKYGYKIVKRWSETFEYEVIQ